MNLEMETSDERRQTKIKKEAEWEGGRGKKKTGWANAVLWGDKACNTMYTTMCKIDSGKEAAK